MVNNLAGDEPCHLSLCSDVPCLQRQRGRTEAMLNQEERESGESQEAGTGDQAGGTGRMEILVVAGGFLSCAILMAISIHRSESFHKLTQSAHGDRPSERVLPASMTCGRKPPRPETRSASQNYCKARRAGVGRIRARPWNHELFYVGQEECKSQRT